MILPMPLALSWCVIASRIEKVPTEWNSMQILFKREVGTRIPTHRHAYHRNRKSSAFGLGQFLNSTWKSVGIQKTVDPVLQIRAIYRYCHKRYGSVAKAISYHRRNGYY